MNNKEFITALAQRTGYKSTDVQRMVHYMIDSMIGSCQEGNVVSVPDFGTFEVKKKLERIMVNPATQQRMLVPPKLVLNFKQATNWKEKLKNGGNK